jgi:hypothetical protein
MADLVDRMCNHTARFFEQYDIRLIGAWQSLVGETNELHFILAWTDLEERQSRWTAFMTDPDWLVVLRETDGESKIREYGQNEIWSPIDCSPLR